MKLGEAESLRRSLYYRYCSYFYPSQKLYKSPKIVIEKCCWQESLVGWTRVRINFQEWRYNMGCMTCKNKNITQTMVDCSKYVCDVHFLLIWLLLIKDYTTNKQSNQSTVWHWIDQIIFVKFTKSHFQDLEDLAIQLRTCNTTWKLTSMNGFWRKQIYKYRAQ